MNNFSNRCCWYPERHEVEINLDDLLDDQRTLVLTSWNNCQGITWSIVADDGVEHHRDPFTAPYFPIWECLDYDSCRDYFDQIPAEVLNALKPFRGDQFGILILLSQNKFLTDLCGKYSTLFWLFFRQAKIDHWSKQQFISLCESGIWNVLKALNLPANQAALQFLSKITASHCYTRFHVDLIQQIFRDLDYRHLNTLETAPDYLLQFLLRYPHLQHVKFLSQLARNDYYVLKDCAKRLQSALIKLDIDNVNQQLAAVLATSDSLHALRAYEKRVSDATR